MQTKYQVKFVFRLEFDLSKCQIDCCNMKVSQCLTKKKRRKKRLRKKNTINYMRKTSIYQWYKKHCSNTNRVTENTIGEYILVLATCFELSDFFFDFVSVRDRIYLIVYRRAEKCKECEFQKQSQSWFATDSHGIAY